MRVTKKLTIRAKFKITGTFVFLIYCKKHMKNQEIRKLILWDKINFLNANL